MSVQDTASRVAISAALHGMDYLNSRNVRFHKDITFEKTSNNSPRADMASLRSNFPLTLARTWHTPSIGPLATVFLILLAGCTIRNVYAETTAPPSPSIGEAQEREIKNKEFQIWLISNILNRSSYWRLSSGQEGPENEQRLFELDPQQKAAAEATALEYITTTYSDHVILRAWNVAQTVDDGSCRLIRKRLKDLSVPTSDPDNRRLIDLGWRAGLSYDFLPEFFNIITSWCEDRDFDYHSAQIRDLGCREMLESLDDFFPDSKRWVRSYSYWVGGPSLIEPLPLSARFGLHKEVQEWLTDHHEAKSWWIQQREKVLQKRIQAETEVLQRFTQGSHTLSGSDHDVREAAYFLHGNKLGAADLSAEFPFELSNRTGLCAPKKTSSPAAPP